MRSVRASGAPRSESKSNMIAGGNHTLIQCGLVRNDRKTKEAAYAKEDPNAAVYGLPGAP